MTFIYIGIVVACGAMIQGAIGFAFGIFSIPILVAIGLPLEEAITLVLGLVVVQTLSSLWVNRTAIPWPDVLEISIPRFLAVVLGIYLLHVVKERWSPSAIKQMIGACLLLIVGVQIWFRPTPRAHLHRGWTWLAGTVSGLMAGLVGMGGPAVVLWVVAHDWDSKKSRTLMWCTFSILVPWQIAVAYHRFGMPVLRSALIGVAYIPVVFIATSIGTQLGNRMSPANLRKIAYVILIGVGFVSIFGPILQGDG